MTHGINPLYESPEWYSLTSMIRTDPDNADRWRGVATEWLEGKDNERFEFNMRWREFASNKPGEIPPDWVKATLLKKWREWFFGTIYGGDVTRKDQNGGVLLSIESLRCEITITEGFADTVYFRRHLDQVGLLGHIARSNGAIRVTTDQQITSKRLIERLKHPVRELYSIDLMVNESLESELYQYMLPRYRKVPHQTLNRATFELMRFERLSDLPEWYDAFAEDQCYHLRAIEIGQKIYTDFAHHKAEESFK